MQPGDPMQSGRRAFTGMLLAGVAGRPLGAPAEEGVTPSTIIISRVIALDGPAGAKAREQEAALQAYFNAVNAAGGLHGRQLLLRTTNEDLRSEVAMRRIHDAQRPFALFLFGGTVGSTIAMQHATAMKMPFVAPNSGANIFHEPVNRMVFNVRARYRDEVIAAIRHFGLVNQRRLALVHVDDAFGRDAAQGYQLGMRDAGVQSVYEGRFDSQKPDFHVHVEGLQHSTPQAVVCIGASSRVAELIIKARQAGVVASFMTLSNNSSAGFAKELGREARGVIVSQVTPPPGNQATRLSRELRQLLAGRPDAELSYAAMEAYTCAKVLVEGLRRAGPQLTREGFVLAMESMKRLDLGGFEVDYSAARHTGSSHVELSILTEDGRYRR